MQFIEIDKARYRKHLNIVIALSIAALVAGSLGISQVLIILFPDESGSHFHWNLLGVVITCLVIGWQLNKYRNHSFMTEVVYVWQLKKALNQINRKILKLKAAARQGNIDALTSLQFCYAGSRQLWHLDDNMITIDDLAVQQAELNSIAENFNLTLKAEDYNQSMLEQF